MKAIELVTGLLAPGAVRSGEPQSAGALTLVPIHHDGGSVRYRTFAAAVAEGTIHIEELGGGGSVNDLTVVNSGTEAVLFVEGEILTGLKQNRTINATMLIPAGAKVVIPVTCVEQGRWGAPAPMARDQAHMPPRIRDTKNRGVQREMRSEAGAREARMEMQSEIWQDVSSHLHEHAAPSPSASYSDLHRHRRGEVVEILERLRPESGQQGVLALVGRRPAVLDVFDRAETLASLWEGLVGSYAADALVARGRAEERHVKEAMGWVHDLAAAPATTHPAVGEGEVVQITGDRGIVSALVASHAVVHLAALYREAASRPGTRMARPTRRDAWVGDGR